MGRPVTHGSDRGPKAMVVTQDLAATVTAAQGVRVLIPGTQSKPVLSEWACVITEGLMKEKAM